MPCVSVMEFARRKPEQMNNPESPVYLGVSRHPEKAMGKNTIDNIVKVMCEAGGIQGRKVNHSRRKTAISSLVHAGVPPTIIQQLSGHKNVNYINNYSTASNEQQRHMSSILTNYSSSCSEPPVTEFDSSSSSLDKCSSALPSTSVVPSSNTDDIIHQTLTEISSYENQPIMKEHVFGNFKGANISGNVIFSFSSKQPNSFKRCRVIYSDSESDQEKGTRSVISCKYVQILKVKLCYSYNNCDIFFVIRFC